MGLTRRGAVRAVRILVRLFFRRVEVVGGEEAPTDRGGILIAWHPNGLVDPALVISTFPQKVVFGARHGLFSWPVVGRLFKALGTVPIYRASDLESTSAEARRLQNAKSLDALAGAVCDGGFAALFPEGLSHDEPFVQELKTGAARLYYRSKQLAPGAPAPAIIPVGLHYNDKTTFRSEVLVEYHPPIAVRPELDAPIANGEEHALAQRSRALTAELEQVLREVTHATESWELHRLMHRVRTLVRAERAHRTGVSLSEPDMVERTLGMARVWTGYYELKKVRPHEVDELFARTAAYDRKLRALRLQDDDLDRSPGIRTKWLPALLALQALVVLLVLPPILLLGYLINALPYGLIKLVSHMRAKAYKDAATIKLIGGTVLYPLTWSVFGLLVALGQIEVHETFRQIPRAPWAAGLTTVLIGAVGGALALTYAEMLRDTWNAIRVWVKRRSQGSTIDRLRQERAELCTAIEALAAGLDLPGEMLEDGRVQSAQS